MVDFSNLIPSQGTEPPAPRQDFPSYAPGGNGQPTRLTLRRDAAAESGDNVAKGAGMFDDLIPTRAGRAKALGVGAVQGVTGNLADEFYGIIKAGGGDLPDIATLAAGPGHIAAKGLMGLARLGYETATGKPGEATQAYTDARDKWRGVVKQSEAEYPGTTLAGNLVGGAVAPVGRALQGANLAQRMGRSAVAGAAYGGVAGFGTGEGAADSAVGAGTGAAVGGLVGGVVAPVAEGVLRAGTAIAAPVINTVRGIINPVGEASRRAGGALTRDAAIDPGAVNRLTPRELVNEVQAGTPAMNIDMGGETTRAVARSAANTSPEARAILNEPINSRFEGQGPRTTNFLEHRYNYPNALAQQEAIDQTERVVNRANYRRAYEEGDRQLWSPELERIVSSPAVTGAMARAVTSGKDRAVTQGFGGFNPGVTVENGMVNFRRGATGVPTYPNLQFWDAAKRELDGAAGVARRQGDAGTAATIEDLSRQLRSELDRMVPSYQAARAGAAHFFGAENALEAGQNYVAQNFANGATRQALARMTPTERQLFQDGFVSRFIETLDRVGDRRNILNQIANNPAAREKLGIALGPQGAGQLEARLRIEGIMDLARTSVQGNSTTARQLVELGLAGGTAGYGYLQADPTAVMNAALVWGAARGHRAIDARVAEQVARMLTSNDPRMLTLGVQMVARSNNIMNALRTTDAALARVGAQQAPRPGVQSLMDLRAGENSPEPPRPGAQ